MGIDLRLHVMSPTGGQADAAFEWGRVGSGSWDLFRAIVAPHATEPPAARPHGMFARDAGGETVYGALPATNRYGDPFEWVRAGDLRPWLFVAVDHHFGKTEAHRAAIVAFIENIPPTTMVVLDWH